ncbi:MULTISPECIES: prolipoprotein diacylglyceryl transferase [Aeromonas]|uniref:prolipoprotein diacylglyceryl transferase n=1 Tax=Aeromonas TaxID=642 RepID=UPI000946AD27|nr:MULTISPECIES: prolipoprotein diacylglyceryl transferase [Aeromonas]MEB8285946.1 prolipoprotein diacylglyceryl transferase [Aeromonas veronii]MBS4694643.1 prolipoprotein diacylglyceryl transferase [Aeromonas allosaccharophila]MCE9847088.1 prolipoprotein diacylglyceryl transferase [Aeromonas allosaccharophila]OLF20574.1 prolipoprotein diacylglyceryl transferase [Aeromonas sp. YN13HZO-058]WDO02546.1 prolipoprotein diacylglyceryl transferase [Aeromonas allosaccharophila]
MQHDGYWVFSQIDPVAFSLGPLSVRWYGLMYLFGFAFAMWLAGRRADAPNSGWTRNEVSDLLFYGFLGVILGGRVGYVLFYNFDLFLADPTYLFKIWTGGMSFHGGLIGVITAMIWFAHKTKRHFFTVADFVAPLIPFGLGVGRIGNFLNGELWGRITDVPWAIIFPEAGPEPRHPSQLYQFALEGVVLFIILNLFWRKNPPRGAISGMFLLFYGLFRFLVEFVRQPDSQLGLYFQEISMGQILSTPMIIAGALMIWVAYKRPQLFGNAVKEAK